MGTLNKIGYQRLIDEDIEALEASNITGLEKMHIRQVLDWSVKMLYPGREVGKALERIQKRLSVELQKQKDAGKQFPTDKEIDDLIDQILKEEQQPPQTIRYTDKKKFILAVRCAQCGAVYMANNLAHGIAEWVGEDIKEALAKGDEVFLTDCATMKQCKCDK